MESVGDDDGNCDGEADGTVGDAVGATVQMPLLDGLQPSRMHVSHIAAPFMLHKARFATGEEILLQGDVMGR